MYMCKCAATLSIIYIENNSNVICVGETKNTHMNAGAYCYVNMYVNIYLYPSDPVPSVVANIITTL